MTYIKPEEIRLLGADKEKLKLFEKFFPKGAELQDIYNTGLFTPEDYYWARVNISFDEEEVKLYNTLFNIMDSSDCFSSRDIKNSCNISSSNKVSSSNWINGSSNINKSLFVGDSLDISNSTDIYYSKEVTDCDRVWKTINASQSSDLYYSQEIQWSDNLFYSTNAKSSSLSTFLVNSENCHLSEFIFNCRNILLSKNLDGTSYQIFNQEVSENEYTKIENKILLLSKINQPLALVKPNFLVYSTYSYEDHKLKDILPKELDSYIKSLPYFTEKIYNILNL